MQKQMKSLFLACVCTCPDITDNSTKDRLGQSNHRDKWHGAYLSRSVRAFWYRTSKSGHGYNPAQH